ncbi:MAG: hypothetical protein KKA81_10915 [Bacteroidetes bacterium]|nr:hypothetical protein [Bacteroidota bacterium]
MPAKYHKLIAASGIVVLFAAFLFLSFNRHSRHEHFSWKSEIYADKAGYYIFLPATFIYGYNPVSYPDSIDHKAGRGFRLDYAEGKVFTKYPYGVALLQTPFFLFTHIIAKPLGYADDGFSIIYHKMVNVASSFYLLAGLLFLYTFLRRYADKLTVILSLAVITLGTNLYYYGLEDTGMSHVYSFFAFSGALFFFSAWKGSQYTSTRKLALFAVFSGLIIALRHINVIFLIMLFFFDLSSVTEFRIRFQKFFLSKNFFIFLGIILVFIIPQAIYNYYLKGEILTYLYDGEGFTNWKNPKIIELWFSPQNGLFIYNPVLLLLFAGMVVMFLQKTPNRWLLVILFLLISYVFSSWHMWWYGCGFGARTFVDYYPILIIPVVILIKNINLLKTHFWVGVFWVIVGIMIVYNLIMFYNYSKCWFWGDWDWNMLVKMFNGELK